MKLKPLQRYIVYILMYYDLGTWGMCDSFHQIFTISNFDIDEYYPYPKGYNKVLEILPELKKKEPEIHDIPTSSYWFDCDNEGNKKRKELLKQCIIEMEQKLFK